MTTFCFGLCKPVANSMDFTNITNKTTFNSQLTCFFTFNGIKRHYKTVKLEHFHLYIKDFLKVTVYLISLLGVEGPRIRRFVVIHRGKIQPES